MFTLIFNVTRGVDSCNNLVDFDRQVIRFDIIEYAQGFLSFNKSLYNITQITLMGPDGQILYSTPSIPKMQKFIKLNKHLFRVNSGSPHYRTPQPTVIYE